jgi:hypothetical protein
MFCYDVSMVEPQDEQTSEPTVIPPPPEPGRTTRFRSSGLTLALAVGLLAAIAVGLFAAWVVWLLTDAATKGVSGTELVILPLLPLYWALPYILLGGAICGIALVVRAKARWVKIVVGVAAAAVLIADGWYSYVQFRGSQESAAQHKEFHRVMGKDETLANIGSCQISTLILAKGKLTVSYVNNNDATGQWVYKAQYADPRYYADYVAKAKTVANRCDITYINDDTGKNDPTSQGTRWVTVAEAQAALDACQIKTFNYTGAMSDDVATGTDTGVKLVDLGFVKHIYVAPAQETAMIPIARAAQKKCGGAPQFWHDGAYEIAPPAN